MGEEGPPLRTGLSSWPCPLELVLAPTTVTYTLEATSLAQCLSHSKEAETSCRKQCLP